jgi:DNA-binding response OmpR family regulator
MAPRATPTQARSTVSLPRSAIPSRFTALATCGAACTALYGHDPVVHEAAGADAAYAEIAARAASGVVRTGGLVVALDGSGVSVDGGALELAGFEHELLLALARSCGVLCSHTALITEVWGAGTAATMRTGTDRDAPRRMLRTRINYLRMRLGRAAELIETVMGRGYRLRDVDPDREDR